MGLLVMMWMETGRVDVVAMVEGEGVDMDMVVGEGEEGVGEGAVPMEEEEEAKGITMMAVETWRFKNKKNRVVDMMVLRQTYPLHKDAGVAGEEEAEGVGVAGVVAAEHRSQGPIPYAIALPLICISRWIFIFVLCSS
ncbi:hypothetical protein ACMD2_10875 [Ananas comosus]|uniref:Uncharacterized protein n=1 Tax=Ananas comosus TaxID=4615 RepID=A0A199VB72_ANACO|nr:hypothetical protein ACMD2_10875 [Ananas comosus]